MEITPKNQAAAVDAYVNPVYVKPKTEPVDANAARPEGVKTDTVVISDAARRVQEAQTELKSIPDVRAEKVSELKRQVESGTYQIDAEKIAGKMIKESLLNDLFK